MHTDLTPRPLPRGWTFQRYTGTDVEGAIQEWKRSSIWEDCDWMANAAWQLAEKFAATIMGLQHAVDPDILMDALCCATVTLHSRDGYAHEASDMWAILYAATKHELNRRQGGRPCHPSMHGKAVAA